LRGLLRRCEKDEISAHEKEKSTMTSIKRKTGVEAGIPGVKVTYESEWADQERSIKIQSPVNGEKIYEFGFSGKRPIYGIVTGFSAKEIKKQGLKVRVSIYTDDDYPQGIAEVDEAGKWMLRSASFRGSLHIVQAELIDKDENQLGLIDRVDVYVERG
jgi:hypothetical protein